MGKKQTEPTEYKTFPSLALKFDEDQGVVDHIITVFGVLDYVNDIAHPGSFKKTIQERGDKVRVLDMHQADSIMRVVAKPVALKEIGRGDLPPEILQKYPEATGGVLAQTKFLMDTPEGRGAFIRLKERAVDEWSYGYDAVDVDYSTVKKDGDDVKARNLRQIRLYEYGPVLWGANPATATLSAKAGDQPPESKPAPEVTENTVRVRVRDPEDFQEDSFRTIRIGNEDLGIQAVVGKLEGETTMTVQSYVFDKEKYTVEEAQEWVDDHKKSLDALGEEGWKEALEKQAVSVPEEDKVATGRTDWPLADRDRAWDNAAAEARVRVWAGAEEGPNEKYRSCHFWYDAEDADNFTAYKLLFCDVVDGKVVAVPRGIFAVAGVLSGARGGADIPAADQAAIKTKVARYYARMREEFDDDGIAPPWEKGGKAVNLSEQVESVREAFSQRYNSPNGPWDYWVPTVYDEYIVVEYDGPDGREWYQVAYTVADDRTEFAPRGEWISGDYVFTPHGEKAAGMRAALEQLIAEADEVLNPEKKAGRVLSQSNADRIISALTTLLDVLENAGIDIPGYEKQPKPKEPEKSAPAGAAPGNTSEAGPSQTPTSQELEIEIEKLSLELMQMEVN